MLTDLLPVEAYSCLSLRVCDSVSAWYAATVVRAAASLLLKDCGQLGNKSVDLVMLNTGVTFDHLTRHQQRCCLHLRRVPGSGRVVACSRGSTRRAPRGAQVRDEINKFKVGAPARVGLVAPNNVVVPLGNTGLDPSQTSFFQARAWPQAL